MMNLTKLGLVFSAVILMAGCSESNHSTDAKVVTAAPTQDNLALITTKLSSSSFGGVDGINGVSSPKSGSVVPIEGEKIEIAGNAVDAVKGEAAAGVLVLIDGKPYTAVHGGERPDIAKALNNPKYLKSQFYAAIPTAEIGVGQHEVKFRVIASDKSGYYESDWVAKLDVKQ
jgi:hypothetical protein